MSYEDERLKSPLSFLEDASPERISQIHEIILSNETSRQKDVNILSALRRSCKCPPSRGSCKCLDGYFDWIYKRTTSPPYELISGLLPQLNSQLFNLINERKWTEIPYLFDYVNINPEIRRIAEEWLSVATDYDKLLEATLLEAEQTLLAGNRSDNPHLEMYKAQAIAIEKQNEIDALKIVKEELMTKVKELEKDARIAADDSLLKINDAKEVTRVKQNEIDELKKEKVELATKVEKLEKDVQTAANDFLMKTNDSKEAALEKQNEIDRLKNENETLATKLVKVEKDAAHSATVKINEAKKAALEIDELKKENEKLATKLEKVEKEARIVANESLMKIYNTEKFARESQNKIDALEKKNEELRTKLKTLENDAKMTADDSLMKINDAKRLSVEKQNEIDGLKKENRGLAAQLEKLERDAWIADHDSITKINDAKKAGVEKQNEIDRLRKINEVLTTKVKALENDVRMAATDSLLKINNATKAALEKQHEIDGLKKEKEELMTKVKGLENDSKTAAHDYTMKINEAKKSAVVKQNEIEKLKQQIDKMENEERLQMRDVEARLEKVQTKLAAFLINKIERQEITSDVEDQPPGEPDPDLESSETAKIHLPRINVSAYTSSKNYDEASSSDFRWLPDIPPPDYPLDENMIPKEPLYHAPSTRKYKERMETNQMSISSSPSPSSLEVEPALSDMDLTDSDNDLLLEETVVGKIDKIGDTTITHKTKEFLTTIAEPLTELVMNHLINKRALATQIKELEKLKKNSPSMVAYKQVTRRVRLPKPQTICTSVDCTTAYPSVSGEVQYRPKQICSDRYETKTHATGEAKSLGNENTCVDCGCSFFTHITQTSRNEITLEAVDDEEKINTGNSEKIIEEALIVLREKAAHYDHELDYITAAIADFSAFLQYTSGSDCYTDCLNKIAQREEAMAQSTGDNSILSDIQKFILMHQLIVFILIEKVKKSTSSFESLIREQVEHLSKLPLSGELIADLAGEFLKQ